MRFSSQRNVLSQYCNVHISVFYFHYCIFSGTVHIYSICRHLMACGHSSKVRNHQLSFPTNTEIINLHVFCMQMVIDLVCGQGGWILAKFFICVCVSIGNHTVRVQFGFNLHE